MRRLFFSHSSVNIRVADTFWLTVNIRAKPYTVQAACQFCVRLSVFFRTQFPGIAQSYVCFSPIYTKLFDKKKKIAHSIFPFTCEVKLFLISLRRTIFIKYQCVAIHFPPQKTINGEKFV